MNRTTLALGLCATLIVVSLDGLARGQDHQGHVGPYEGSIDFPYSRPDGRKQIEERLVKPPSAQEPQGFRTLLQRFEAADSSQLVPVLRSTSSFAAESYATGAFGFDGGVRKTEVVYSFGLEYKRIPLSEHTSQNVIVQEAGTARKLVLMIDRNVPKIEELASLETARYAEGVPPEVAARLEEIGLEKSRADYQTARKKAEERAKDRAYIYNANVYIDRDDPPHQEIQKIKGRPPQLVWTYVVLSDNLYVPLNRRFYVPLSGRPEDFDFEDKVYFFDDTPVTGSVKGTYWAERKSNLSSGASTDSKALANIKVVRGTDATYTDNQGKFSFKQPGSGGISVSLDGPYCRIVNQAGGLLQASRAGNNFDFNATGELQLAQVTAFRWVNEVALFTRGLVTSPNLPPGSRPRLLDEVRTRVNISLTCNANWDGRSLNFFKSGFCLDFFGNQTDTRGSNSAYSDIIFHEYGHGVDDALGTIRDRGYSEGFGDAVAILMTQDHVLGADWKKPGNGPVRSARDAANNVQWPDVEGAEEHQQGMAYNGFVWALIEALAEDNPGTTRFDVARDLVFGAALRNPTSIPNAVLQSFLFDYQSGENHYEALKKAAKAHGIPYPKNRDVLADPDTLDANVLAKGDPGY